MEATPSRGRYGLPLLTGPLLWACHFPLAWGWLGWVALVPLLSLVRSPMRWPARYGLAYVTGLLFFVPALQWMRLANPMMLYAWLALAAYLAAYFPLAIRLLRWIDRRAGPPLMVAVPLVWVPLEFARSRLFGGFAWYTLGHTQHAFLHLIQLADLAGVAAVSAVVAVGNGWIADALASWPRAHGLYPPAANEPVRPRVRALVMLTVFVLALSYGVIQLAHPPFATGPRLALLQGNLAQSIRNDATVGEPSADATTVMVRHFKDLALQAAKLDPKPDLVVWPETSFVGAWQAVGEGVNATTLPAATRENLVSQARWIEEVAQTAWKTDVLLGVNIVVIGPDRSEATNAAQLVRADGRIVERYDKMHRVPFGEYIPYAEWLPFLKRFNPYGEGIDYGIVAGASFTRFPLDAGGRRYTFGALICYEDGDDTLARRYVEPGDRPPVDFLVNLSNDGWFHGSAEHEEHLAVSRFRAVEARRPLARAVNMGISALIDADGRVVKLPGPTWAASKRVADVMSVVVPLDTRGSLFARWGDWLPAACGVGLALCLLGRRSVA